MAAHRYWRLKVNTYYGVAVRIATLALFDVADSSVNVATTGSGTASASVQDAGGAGNAFDASTATLWGSASPSAGMWLRWDFGAGNNKDIIKVQITNSNFTTYSVNACELQWSDDGTTFTTAVNVSNPTANDAVTTTWVPGVITVAAVAPKAQLSFNCGLSVALTAPSPTLAFIGGGSAALTSPSASLLFIGRDSAGDQAADLTAPRPVLTITTGANSRNAAPKPTLAASATVTQLASADLSAPLTSLSASGIVTMLGSAALSVPIQSLIGYSGAVCSISITGGPTLTATGVTGGVGDAQLTAPLFELTASATAQNRGSALLTAPSAALGGQAQAYLIAPGFTLTAIGTAVVTATYEAYALNLNHTPRGGEQPVDELTHYTNFPFTHVVRYKNSYYGANSTGLYLLEGTTDDGADINWNVQTAFSDFGSPNLKTLNSAYFGGRFGPVTNVTLLVSEADTEAYVYTTPLDDTAKNYRQAFGRGNKARYYAVAADGAGEVTIDSITFNIATLARRI